MITNFKNRVKLIYTVVVLFSLFSCKENKKHVVEICEGKQQEINNSDKNLILEEVLPSYKIADFENNEHYFIRNIDTDNDGLLDKIVSAVPYQGGELFLFLNNENNYQFALKTTNFSEDGGNQIVDVSQTEDGFKIFTAFPDRGILEAHHHIKFINKKWILTHTVYRIESSNAEDAFVYNCTVKQNIDMSDKELLNKLKSFPNEVDREKVCKIEIK